ncbi:MAG TPA: ATP-binding protein [Candidatus Thermoplasmatota archaeon]|nr:ATP-binding protein [Candidatus Thermoplasmatota archaeon]
MALRRQVGIIYGSASSTAFDVAVSDGDLKRLDYIEAEQDGTRVLCQVESVDRKSRLSLEQAMQIPSGLMAETDDTLTAGIRVIGFQDAQGRIQTPRVPFRAGTPVHRADDRLVITVLGLEGAADEGAFLGHIKGSRIPVTVHMDTLAQKHVSVLAKTGAGKSYTVGVLLEELLKANVPLVILDPHGEYGSLRNPNIDEGEVAQMSRFGVKPKSFAKQIKEYALDTTLNPEAQRLVLQGMNLEGREIVEMLGSKLTGGQVGVLYQAIKEVKEFLPAYTLRDIIDGVSRNKASSKWNVLNALEVLESTKIFDIRGTPVKELVAAGQCSIINLKGITPDVQEIVVTRIASMLWEARKRNEVPAHILVVEEAHNFCPERNVGNAVSGAMLRTVASEGRKFGLGLMIVSQRPAKVDKNVLSQCNTQVVLKVTNPNDLKAIVQSVEGISMEVADEVQRLPVGVALVAGGGLTQPVFVDVRPRLTRHGGKSVSVLHQEVEEEDDSPEAPVGPLGPPAGEEALADPFASLPPGDTDGDSSELPVLAPAPDAEPLLDVEEHIPSRRPTPTPPATRLPARGTPEAWNAALLDDILPPRRALGHRTPPTPATPPPDEPVLDFQPEPALAWGKPEEPRIKVPPPRRTWNQADAREIQRVAVRVGAAAPGQDPQRTLDVLWDLAHEHQAEPDGRLQLYREIAAHVCHVEQPACIRCPLKDHCAFYEHLRQERQKTRGPLRRLWGA